MSTAREKQARRRAKIKADPELYQAKLLKDRTDSIASSTPGTDNAAQHQLPALKFTVGQWVVVKYQSEDFPGEMTRIENSDVEVNVMHRSANAWKWPRLEDKIMRIINPPSVAGSRGQFAFKDII